MNNLRPIEAAENAVESITEKTRGKLIDWLDHYDCKHCGSICTAETEWVESQCLNMPIWKCPDCEKRYYRDSDVDKHTADMWDR